MELDYKKLGFKAGLEVHQQLDTGKLFCRCPSGLREEKPDFIFKRQLRAVASELGEYDKAALEATQKGITYIYEGYNDTTCLVETDSEPPHQVDSEALRTILEVALLTGAHIPEEMIVMRKTVVDGSNTSAFQRTMLAATGGKLQLKGREINLQAMALEEDAARPIEKKEKEIVYRLDRLGIALIELATDPELYTPGEVKEAALEIGSLFRLTGKAKRGLGTIRQDVNISIAEGARVEIKGVQQLDLIDECVKREVERQVKLLEIREELNERGITGELLENMPIDVTKEFENTESKLIKGCLGKCSIVAAKVRGFARILGKEVQPGRRFGTELSDYVKAKTGLRGILHSDELPGYGITKEEIEAIRATVDCGKNDGFVLVCAEKARAIQAIGIVIERCRQALVGVPEETRDALENANTSYSRPLPGAARMYPETDLAPVKVSEKELGEIKKELPKSANERRSIYIKKYGLGENLADKMKLNNYAKFFGELVEKGYGAKATAVLLLEGLVQLKREGINVNEISNEMIEETLKALKEKKITQDVLLKVLANWVKEKEKPLGEIVKGMNLGTTNGGELEGIVRKIVEKNRGMIKERGIHSANALMGDVMKEVRGRASGKEVMEMIMKEAKKVLGE